MTLGNMMVRDVTIIRAGTTTDRYGNALPDWTNTTSTSTKGWLGMQPGTEEGGTRVAGLSQIGTLTIEDRTVDINAGDRVTIDGVLFEVDGVPLMAWTPRGAHHIEVNVRAVTG